MRTNLCVCLLLSLAAASTSYALDNGECGTPGQITAKLKSEGQRSIASAERIERENGANSLYGMVFTVNGDRSAGYVLQSDKPTGEAATKVCVVKRLAGVRLFDARKPGIRPETLLKAPDDDAVRHCDELIRSRKLNAGTCAPFNRSARAREANGERIWIQGFEVVRAANGTYQKSGTLITVTGNMTGSVYDDPKQPLKGIIGGVFSTSLPDGATIINMSLVYAEYTPYGQMALNQ